MILYELTDRSYVCWNSFVRKYCLHNQLKIVWWACNGEELRIEYSVRTVRVLIRYNRTKVRSTGTAQIRISDERGGTGKDKSQWGLSYVSLASHRPSTDFLSLRHESNVEAASRYSVICA